MLDLAGSPSFNYEAAAVSLNTANATRTSRKLQSDSVEMDRREKIHRALQNFGLATAGASIASPVTAPVTEIAGGVADLIDGVLYSLEGEHGNAALSYASILPYVGAAVAAKRGMKLAEKADEELIDIYHGYESRFKKHNIVDVNGEKFAVGRQHRFFKRLDDDQLEFVFRNAVPNPEDGSNLFRRYKETGEIPLSLGRVKARVGPKQYKEWGKTKEDYLDDLYDANEYYDELGSWQYRNPGEKGFLPMREEILPRDYFGPVPQVKQPFKEFVTPSIYLERFTLSKEFTTPKMVWASSSPVEAMSYGDQLLHFKVPKSYIRKQIKDRKLRGNDKMFVEHFSDEVNFKEIDGLKLQSETYGIVGYPKGSRGFEHQLKQEYREQAVNQMIFDEGLPMRFLYKVKGRKDVPEAVEYYKNYKPPKFNFTNIKPAKAEDTRRRISDILKKKLEEL